MIQIFNVPFYFLRSGVFQCLKVMKCGIVQIIVALTIRLSQTQFTESLFVGRFPRRSDSDMTDSS